MDARMMFLADHARVHSAAVADAGVLQLGDLPFTSLTDTQMRRRLPGHTSLAWYLWHLARAEDVAVNAVLRGVPEVLDAEGWESRLGVPLRDIGTGMSNDEVDEFSADVDLAALRAYRNAVGRATRARVAALDFDTLDEPLTRAGQVALAAGGFRSRVAWVVELWDGLPRATLLSMQAVGHSYFHLGEAGHVARLLGRPGR